MTVSIYNYDNLNKFLSEPKSETRRVFITGDSGSGKSTLWRSLHTFTNNKIAFPTRFISRSIRLDDDPNENQHLDINSFATYFRDKSIEFYWPKFLPNGVEYYGFKFCLGRTIVYGCNNEFLNNSKYLNTHSNLFKSSIIAHVTCSLEKRKKRLFRRYNSQNISISELQYRLESTKNDFKFCDIAIDNTLDDISVISKALISLLSLNI